MDPAVRKAYTECKWNGPSRTALNPIQEVNAAKLRVQEGFSTAQEETAQLTGGDWNHNIRQRAIEAKRKKEVDDTASPPPPTQAASEPQKEEEPPDGGGK